MTTSLILGITLMINHDDIEDVNDGGRLPWEEVWTPDIVLYNAAGDGEQGREMRTLIQVNNELWIKKFCY